MDFPIHTHETNQRHHLVRLEESLIHQILARAVADQIGVDLTASNVDYRVTISTPNAGSVGPDFNRKSATVTIIEDFGPVGG